MHEHGIGEADLAELAVLMRSNAARHPGAHFQKPLTVDEVLASRPIATPLKLLDCCPVSDGGAAVVVTREPVNDRCVPVLGTGQAHLFLHVSAAPLDGEFGAATSVRAALAAAGIELGSVDYAAIYDSFTITLAILLEEIGLALAHLVEAQLQLTGRAGDRQAGEPELALLHGDGGVLSSHVSLVLGAPA
jgi:acetyl-CoA acetyltransferase